MKSGPDSCFSKMCPQYEPEDSTRFFENLPKEGMIVDGQCYRQRKSGHRTKGKGGFSSQPIAVQMQPTPWPTPTKEDYRKRGPASRQQGLPEAMRQEPGQLNPDWVEWLMGVPVGWTKVYPDILAEVTGKKNQKASPGPP